MPSNKKASSIVVRLDKLQTRMEAQLEELSGLISDLSEELVMSDEPVTNPNRPKKKAREKPDYESDPR